MFVVCEVSDGRFLVKSRKKNIITVNNRYLKQIDPIESNNCCSKLLNKTEHITINNNNNNELIKRESIQFLYTPFDYYISIYSDNFNDIASKMHYYIPVHLVRDFQSKIKILIQKTYSM